MKFGDSMLGEMEEVVLLTVASLSEAYSKQIADEISNHFNRKLNISSVQIAIIRLLKKEYLTYHMSPVEHKRGGKSKRIFYLTKKGRKSIQLFMDKKLILYNNGREIGTL